MAILDSKGFLHGRLGDNVYRKVGQSNIVSSKPCKDSRTEGSKKAAEEFGLISNTSRTIRKVLCRIFSFHDGQMGNRLISVLTTAFSECETFTVNNRDFHDIDLSLLKGFQVNLYSPLDRMLKVRPMVMPAADGSFIVTIPAIRGKRYVVYPKSPLVVRSCIQVVPVVFNFREDYYQVLGIRETEIKGKMTDATEWKFDPAVPEGGALLVFMSLKYYVNDVLNGRQYLNGRELNPVELIGAWQYRKGRPGSDAESNGHEQEPLPGYRGKDLSGRETL